MVSGPLVEILMATYNGEKFLSEQIDSIIYQSYRNIRLLIHDDGSIDRTLYIVKKYQKQYPDKVFLIEDGIKCGGAKENFAHLMRFAKANYIMFSDQDDVWIEDKIEITLKKMLECERRFGKNTPIIIHTDLKVVDTNLKTLSKFFWDYCKINPYNNSLRHLLLLNTVTGCASMINRALLINSMPVPKDAMVHDWWVALVCTYLNGHIEPLPKQTVLYRQHRANTIGAKEFSFQNLISRFLFNPIYYIKLKFLRDYLTVGSNIRKQIKVLHSFMKQKGYHNEFLENLIKVIDTPLRRKMFYIKNECLSDHYCIKIGQIIFL